MTDAAAIAGTYSDLKLVKSRSVAQVVVEIPIEKAESFIAAFGMPIPGKEQHVALALLKPSSTDKPGQSSQAAGQEKGRKSWGELTYAQRSGILRNDKRFQQWIGVDNADDAANFIRLQCRVESCSHIDHSEDASERFDLVHRRYCQATGQMAEMRS